MKAITISSLRKDMKQHFDDVSRSGEVIIVPRNKEEDAVVILPIREYNALMETEHLFSTETNSKRLRESIGQMAKGKNIPYELPGSKVKA